VTAYTWTVPGRPVSWQRMTPVAGRPTMPAKARAAKRLYQLAARAGRPAGWRLDAPAYVVTVRAYYPDRRYGDVDRIVGLPLDAMEGVAYGTDRDVCELRVLRHVDRARPRLEVRVKALESDEPRGEVAR
jgi:Holliday junction resolvase RusA-like endonuclease